MTIFRYLQEKDEFEKYYRQHLVMRLHAGKTVYDEMLKQVWLLSSKQSVDMNLHLSWKVCSLLWRSLRIRGRASIVALVLRIVNMKSSVLHPDSIAAEVTNQLQSLFLQNPVVIRKKKKMNPSLSGIKNIGYCTGTLLEEIVWLLRFDRVFGIGLCDCFFKLFIWNIAFELL